MVGVSRHIWRIFEDIPEDSSNSSTMMERAAFGSNYAASDVDTDIPAQPIGGLQRQISRSEPHLNIPRFHIGQTAGDGDEALSRVMSGLFGADEDYHVPTTTALDRSPPLPPQQPEQPLYISRALLSIGGQPLRKSASAVDQRSLLPSSDLSGTSTSEANAMVGTSQQPDSLMRVASASGITPSSSPMHAVKNNQPSQTPSLVEQAANLRPLQQRPNSSFSNFFGRGFFAKPVMGSQEESYRYLMALDR